MTNAQKEKQNPKVRIMTMKVYPFFTIIFFLTSLYLTGEPKKEPSAKSYLLQNIRTGDIVKQKEVTLILPIASITKLVTALISISELKQTEFYKVHKSTVLRNEGDKSAILKEGEFYSLKDLLLTMLVSSTNVSAISIATDVSGNTENFIIKMNDWAKENNLKDTNFGDTFGLSPNSKSSASDIAKILDIVERNSSLYEILSTTNYSIKEKNGKIQNLSTTNEMPFYKDFRIFGKTGTTKLAGKCFAGFIVKGKERWKIIILGSENVFGDIKILIDSIK